MRFRHSSRFKGRRPDWLRRATAINVVGIHDDGEFAKTVVLEAPLLGEAAEEMYLQPRLFDPLPDGNHTALDVLSDAVGVIASGQTESDWYDTNLLGRIESFEAMFNREGVAAVGVSRSPANSMTNSQEALIDSRAVEAAAKLRRRAPKSKRVRIAGILDMLRDSDRAFDLIVDDKTRIRGVWEDRIVAILCLLGKQVVVDAMAVFRPSGRLLRIEAGGMAEAGPFDSHFSRVPTPSTLRFDRRSLRSCQTPSSNISNIIGQWPGTESEEELRTALRDI